MSTPTTTLTSLLNSLHTHLQSQTQLLPTLHVQLGLPPSALEDDLKDLQEQLIQGVERQVDLRRRQVDEWMSKCDEVEAGCLQYTKALGGNVKATGTTLGELRKENNLPRRFQMVTEFQEKTRQAYYSKLEQLTTITNRLNNLANTLGKEYFADNVLEPIGITEDEGSPRDVTPERFMKLEKELVKAKAEVTKRLQELANTFIQIDWLQSELGASLDDYDDLAPTYTNFADDPFIASTPTPASRNIGSLVLGQQSKQSQSDFHRTFARFIAQVEESEQDAPITLQNVEPTTELISWAQSVLSSLETLKSVREVQIQTLYDQLEVLWRRLGVADEDMDAFVDMHRGSTESVVREYEEELERMMELKREKMSEFVRSAREEIMGLWDDLMTGEEERAEFPGFADDEFTEELLSIHEDYIRQLREDRRAKAPLLASIKKYFRICEEEKELAAAASDQTRLLGRGGGTGKSGRDPGRLLREEKMRKRVQKEKPRLEQDLLAALPIWEQENGTKFLVYGESMLSALIETVNQAQQESANRRARSGSRPGSAGASAARPNSAASTNGRGGSIPARATTPTGNSNSTSTGFAPGRSTAGAGVTSAVRPKSAMGSTSNVPSSIPTKRPRTNSSASATQSQVPTKAPGSTARNKSKAVPVPRMTGASTQKQNQTLGHGRTPNSGGRATKSVGGGGIGSATRIPSGGLPNMANKRYPSVGHVMATSSSAAADVRQAPRPRGAGFKPRPSLDRLEQKLGVGGAPWMGSPVNEAEEDD